MLKLFEQTFEYQYSSSDSTSVLAVLVSLFLVALAQMLRIDMET
ncbi:MAG: hypothetical protein PUF51_04095 [Bifidobacteriaceae bacterium]|jgi:hypothetical protein|nr:hypothetical protein [Bifidobacteriaceae bacterium]